MLQIPKPYTPSEGKLTKMCHHIYHVYHCGCIAKGVFYKCERLLEEGCSHKCSILGVLFEEVDHACEDCSPDENDEVDEQAGGQQSNTENKQ